MMFKKTITWLSVIAVCSLFICATTATAASETTLKGLQATFNNQKKLLLFDYLKQLATLETAILTSNKQQGANAVKTEIERIKDELAKINKTSPAAKPAITVVKPKPAPKPIIKKRDPKIHASEVQGLAGAKSFSKNNIYTFHLADIGKVSTIQFWATGRRSIETSGNVWLVTPYGRREKIKKWKERNFSKPATEISTYKKIKPISADISKLVTKPGTYKVEFEWTGGIDPLVIYRVELTS